MPWRTKREAEAALAALPSVLAELGLEPQQAKTRIVHLREGGEGVRFPWLPASLGTSRNPRPRHVAFLARWPSREAMQRARDRIRELTLRKRLRDPVEEVVQDINRYVRGWGGYFRLSRLLVSESGAEGADRPRQMAVAPSSAILSRTSRELRPMTCFGAADVQRFESSTSACKQAAF